MADKNKEVGFKLVIDGISQAEMQMSRLTIQTKNLTKELTALEKEMRKGIASNENIAKHAALTKELDKQKKALQDVKKELDIGGYGTYWTKLSDAIGGIGKHLTDMVGPIAVATAALGVAKKVVEGIKDAFQETAVGMELTTQLSVTWKQIMQDLLVNRQINLKNIKESWEAGRKLVDLQIEEGEESLKLSHINREEQAVRELSIDRTKTHTERLEYLTKVTELETEKTRIKVEHLEKEKKIKEDLAALQPANQKLALDVLAIETQINNVYAEEDAAMRRVNTQRTAFIKEREDMYNKWMSEIDSANEKRDSEAKKADDDRKKREIKQALDSLSDAREVQEIIDKTDAEYQERQDKLFKDKVDFAKQLFDQNESYANQLKQDNELRMQQEEEAEKEHQKVIIDIRKAVIQGLEQGADAVFQSKRARLQAEMTAELSNMELTEAQKAEIKKKYAREEQKMDVSKAIIDGALAIAKTFAEYGFTPPGWIQAALGAITMGIQVATIKAQKFATGGLISGGLQLHSDTSRDNTLIYAKQGEAVLNQVQIARLGGSGAMRRARVPGFADGGFIGTGVPDIPSMGFDYQQMASLMNSLSVRLDVNKLNSAERDLQVVTTHQRI